MTESSTFGNGAQPLLDFSQLGDCIRTIEIHPYRVVMQRRSSFSFFSKYSKTSHFLSSIFPITLHARYPIRNVVFSFSALYMGPPYNVSPRWDRRSCEEPCNSVEWKEKVVVWKRKKKQLSRRWPDVRNRKFSERMAPDSAEGNCRRRISFRHATKVPQISRF